MEMSVFFRSVLEADTSPVVLCDTEHKIIYMNSSAIQRYEKWGGDSLVGRSLLDCHNDRSNEMIINVIDWFGESVDNNRVFTFHNEKENKDVYMIALRDDEGKLIGYYEKHEFRNHETIGLYAMTRGEHHE